MTTRETIVPKTLTTSHALARIVLEIAQCW